VGRRGRRRGTPYFDFCTSTIHSDRLPPMLSRASTKKLFTKGGEIKKRGEGGDDSAPLSIPEEGV